MRDLTQLDKYRDLSPATVKYFGGPGDSACGSFLVPSPVDRKPCRVIASAGEGWEHVSVSRPHRCPTWAEMEHVKRMFWRDDEAAMQLHVPAADHISLHTYCLHLWRPADGYIPRPPTWMIA